MPLAFLSARWTNLAIVTYACEPAALDPFLPPGCVADVVDGRAFASLVAFDFLDARVLGVRWPGVTRFPQVNLRCYVRGPDGRRGVRFVRELVPRRLVAWVARALYHESFLTVPMARASEPDAHSIATAHRFTVAGREQSIRVVGERDGRVPAEESLDRWFTEHEWGFGTSRGGRRIAFRIDRDAWATHPVTASEVRVEFAHCFGERWAFLDGATPHHVALAAGGPVRVYPWRGTKHPQCSS